MNKNFSGDWIAKARDYVCSYVNAQTPSQALSKLALQGDSGDWMLVELVASAMTLAYIEGSKEASLTIQRGAN